MPLRLGPDARGGMVPLRDVAGEQVLGDSEHRRLKVGEKFTVGSHPHLFTAGIRILIPSNNSIFRTSNFLRDISIFIPYPSLISPAIVAATGQLTHPLFVESPTLYFDTSCIH